MQSRFRVSIESAAWLVAVLMAVLISGACGRKHAVASRGPTPPAGPAGASRTAGRSSAPRTTAPAIPGSIEYGIASWYGVPFHGRAAADGEIYDMEKLTAAHRTLPFNTWVRVTNLTNQKTVEVRITDRGPFVDGRVIDLSHAAAQTIDLIGPGVTQVRLDIINAPPPGPDGNLYSVQAGIFSDRTRAERISAALETKFGATRLVFKDGRPPAWRVLVGVEESIPAANALARQIQAEVGSGFVVHLDELGPPSK